MFLPKMSKKLPTVFTITTIAALFIMGFSLPAIAGQSRSKSGRGKSAPRSTRVSLRSKISRRSKQSRSHVQSEPLPPVTSQAPPTYPDSIEVFEYGSSDSPILGRLLNMPNTTIAPTTGLEMTDPANQPKRLNFKMESSRVSEIQQALGSRGFYRGEPSGVYDDSTVEAMRRFQEKENIPITGYPTAHALRRLGLAKW